MGWSLLSVRVDAEGPSPRPSWPWHFQHSSFWKSSPPCLMLASVSVGSGGIVIGVPGFSVTQRAENVFTNATKFTRSSAVRVSQCGMLVKLKPRSRELYKSESNGNVPVGVERHLKIAATKFRGRGSK